MSKRKLKPGWQWVKFGDVVRQVKDRVDPKTSGLTRYIAGEHMDTDDLRLRRWGEIGNGYLGPAFHMRFKPGQVLYGSRRTYLRKVAVADFEGICANTTYVLEPKDPNILLPELLPFIMQTDAFNEHSVKQSKGSVNPYINFSDLEWYEFALPPLEEQRRMVELLQAANVVIEAYQLLGHSSWNTLRSLQKKYFVECPEGHRVKIGQIANIQNGTTPSRSNKNYWNGDIPWLPTGKVNDRQIFSAEEFITQKALAECSLDIIPAGSTLIAMIGQGQTRGRAARLEFDACINQNFGAVTPNSEVDPWYLFYHLEVSYENLRAWSHGTNQHALNCSLIREFNIFLPTIERQSEIAEELQAADEASHLAKQRQESGKRLQKSLQEVCLQRGGES